MRISYKERLEIQGFIASVLWRRKYAAPEEESRDDMITSESIKTFKDTTRTPISLER